MQADKLMKWRSRGPREDWASDEDTSNEGFNPGATSPPCLFYPRLPPSLSPSLSLLLSIILYLLPSLALHKASRVNSMSKCMGKVQHSSPLLICRCVWPWISMGACSHKTRERWRGVAGFLAAVCLLPPNMSVPTEDCTDLTH